MCLPFSDWSLPAIVELLTRRMFETDKFDYKQSLPHAQDENGKDRLRRVCCAFANSDGGFLVFGISDDRAQQAEDRLMDDKNRIISPAKLAELKNMRDKLAGAPTGSGKGRKKA